MSKVFWKIEDETSRLAAQLHLDNPELNLLEAKDMDDLKALTLGQARAAMGKVIPKARHRPLNTVFKLKPELLKAYEYLRENGMPAGVKPTKKGPAPGEKLTEAEWLKVAAHVKAQYPNIGPGNVTLRVLHQATQTLPPGRQLKFGSITAVRRPFDAALKALAAGAPVAQLPPPPDPSAAKLPKVFWKPFEYDLMVRYLHKLHPHFIHSTTLAGLTPTDVKDAAKHTLEPHRQRPGLTTVSGDRERFLEAFARLKAALAAEEEEKRKADEERRKEIERKAAEAEAAAEAARREAEETLRLAREEVSNLVVATAAAPAPEAAPSNATDSLDALVDQFAVSLAKKFSNAFATALLGDLQAAFRATLPGMIAAVNTAPTPRKHNPEPTVEAGPKLPKICVAGLLKPAHVTEVKEAFGRLYDLRFYHPDQSPSELIAKSRCADKTILLTDQISHMHQNALDAAHVSYTRLPGSVGRLKDFLSSMQATQ